MNLCTVIWTSFDLGEVLAKTYEEAKQLAIIELNKNFGRANELLGNFASINYDEDEISIEEVR